jgi:hypothetical protein
MIGTRWRAVAAACTVAAIAVAACGGDDDDSSASNQATTSTSVTPATASAELCKQRDELKSSIKDLQNVDVIKNGTSALDAAISRVNDNLEQFKSTARGEFDTEIDGFEQSLSKLQSAVGDVGSNGMSPVVQALRDVLQSGSALLTSLDSLKCD